jgi:hypothetical protein
MGFGPMGLLLGPLVLSLAVSAMRIYEMDVLRAPPSSALPVSSGTPLVRVEPPASDPVKDASKESG